MVRILEAGSNNVAMTRTLIIQCHVYLENRELLFFKSYSNTRETSSKICITEY